MRDDYTTNLTTPLIRFSPKGCENVFSNLGVRGLVASFWLAIGHSESDVSRRSSGHNKWSVKVDPCYPSPVLFFNPQTLSSSGAAQNVRVQRRAVLLVQNTDRCPESDFIHLESLTFVVYGFGWDVSQISKLGRSWWALNLIGKLEKRKNKNARFWSDKDACEYMRITPVWSQTIRRFHSRIPKLQDTKTVGCKKRSIHYLLLVYTTPVNSPFRAIWLVPLSRDIKYYSPPGGFRRKKWRTNPILS